jgi:hypothetical protein
MNCSFCDTTAPALEVFENNIAVIRQRAPTPPKGPPILVEAAKKKEPLRAGWGAGAVGAQELAAKLLFVHCLLLLCVLNLACARAP